MEAPLGASALMHSSTLVIAGVVLAFKLAPLLEQSTTATRILILWGAWTSLFAAFVACFQFELKIIMAYSTISSMGFLYCLLGLHAYGPLLNYLVIHAYIKIFFFLVMGAIMMHCNGCQDVRWMGGLLHYIPSLYVFYTSGSVSLAGLPYWSGYYCKSAAWFTAAANNNLVLATQTILLVTSICTYVYLGRAGNAIFFGPKNGHRSIYRQRHQSFLAAMPFFGISFMAAYSGIIWTHMCLSCYNNILITMSAIYNISDQLDQLHLVFGWAYMILVYIIITLHMLALNVLLLVRATTMPAFVYYFYNFAYVLFVLFICL